MRFSTSSPLFGCTLLVAMVALAAACSGASNSDDDDDDSGGESGESSTGGSSGKGGSSSGGKGGSSSGGTGALSSGGSSSGSSGSGGSGGSSGGAFLQQCRDVCDRASVCPDYDAMGCLNGCDQFNSLVTSNVCKAEIQALYDCGSSESDLCGDSSCSTETSDLYYCLLDYCTANPNASLCQASQ